MEFDLVVARYVFGLLRREELPAQAVAALEQGLDSPSLRRLAVADCDDADEVRRFVIASAHELNIAIPTRAQAGMAIARWLAAQIVNGTVHPYEGARQIWWEISHALPGEESLLPFVGLASEYEDDVERRPLYAQKIVEHARTFLNTL